jgi:hypothetical protein
MVRTNDPNMDLADLTAVIHEDLTALRNLSFFGLPANLSLSPVEIWKHESYATQFPVGKVQSNSFELVENVICRDALAFFGNPVGYSDSAFILEKMWQTLVKCGIVSADALDNLDDLGDRRRRRRRRRDTSDVQEIDLSDPRVIAARAALAQIPELVYF